MIEFPEKLGLITTPTKFYELKNLRRAINCRPRIFIKRDDLTDVGLGGNKTRKLEYVMADAVRKGADTVITCGGEQSNHCRQTLAYANLLGMECHLVLSYPESPARRKREQKQCQGNRFLFDVFGANIHYASEWDFSAFSDDLAETLKNQGKNPYVIPVGASVPLGSLGYIDSAREIAEQSAELSVKIGSIFTATGSAGTQCGLIWGAELHMPGCAVHGVSVSRGKSEQAEKTADICNATGEMLGLSRRFSPDEIIIHDEYVGDGYAIPTESGVETIRLLGRTESLLLDPVYTGKAMDGMLDIIKSGALDSAEAVVFVHTGGGPAIYNFTEYFD